MRSTLIYSVLIIWLQLLGLIFPDAAAMELADLQFNELDSSDGLSSTVIIDIAEDSKGYIWLATPNGLNRYSGYDIKQYHPSDNDPHALPSGFIQHLFVDSKGILWVATHNGLSKYRPKSDDFETFNSHNSAIKSDIITTISESSDGDILFSDMKFLYSYSKSTNKVTVITQAFKAPSNIKLIFDEANRTWIGSNELGAKIIDKKTGQLYNLNEVNPWGLNFSFTALHDIKVINGKYWLATNNGVFVLSARNQIIRHISNELSLNDSSVNVLSIEVINNNIWLGSDSGLHIIENIEANNQSVTYDSIFHLKNNSTNLSGLTQSIILNIAKDRTGAVWIGSSQGAFKYHPKYADVRFHPTFSAKESNSESTTIWGIVQDASKDIYFVSQQKGIEKLDGLTGELQYIEITPQLDNDVTFWDLVIDENNYYWIASSIGLLIYEKIEGKLHLVKHLFDGDFIDYLHADNNYVWVWRNSTGLLSINIANILQENNSNIVKQHSIESTSNLLLPIFTDSFGRLWLRDENRVIIYAPTTNAVIAKLDSKHGISSPVYSVYETNEAFWLTTRSDGVIQLNKNSLAIEKKQVRNDQNGFIFSSVGVYNTIWYADAAGVHQIHLPSLKQVSSISNEQLEFNSLGESAVLATQDGEIYFGGNKGFNKISRAAVITDNTERTKTQAPELFEFSIFGEPQNTKNLMNTDDELYEQDFLHRQNISYKQEKSLAYDESRFSISFGLLNPVYPESVLYRYKLNGFDDLWIYIDKNRTAQFNNISFGNYLFEVQAKEPGKDWSASRTLEINIARPPWLHTAAIIFYALVLAAILIFIIRQYQLRKRNQQSIRESEERLKLTLWSSGDELWDWDIYHGQVFRANTWGTLDFPQDDIRTSGAYDSNIHPNDINRVQDALRCHLEGKSDFYELAYRAKTFKNQWVWILDRGKVVERDHNQQPVRMTGTLKNINHLKEAEEQLNLFKRSIENISEGVFITNTQFKFISVNNAYCSYTGETREQALASYMHFHLYPDAFTEEIKKTLKTKGNWSGEVESVRVNGERYEMELNIDAVHDEDGSISHFVGVFSDITSRKNTEKELLKLANIDPLTELPNRSFFQASHQNLVRKSTPHTLLCLDMDNFKKINDSLGHQTGDILIKQIAKRLQRITGKNATCYRLGGDEFSILMENNTNIHTVTHYAQNVLDTLSRPFIINKQEFVLGASVGIAFYPSDGTSPQELLKNADTAMYFAKNNGGNSYQFFSGEMNQNAVRQLQIENLIRQGIKDDLFTVYYQPKVDIASGKLVSMEALVRFEHPQKGIVSPGQFIPLAEQTGQIIEIGEQVLRKACTDTKRWVNQGIFSGRVAVNISVKQFELPDLDDRINRILSEVGLSPLHLECEITEGTLMENPENGLRMMSRLRERGIHLALDDFGTGYSSLAYLKRFPLNTLKIDKAFIDGIASSSVDRHMTAAIINIAHNLGLKVVAEGVEDEQQLNILRRYDCEMLQGFLYSRPLNAERFEKLLSENQKLHSLLGQSKI